MAPRPTALDLSRRTEGALALKPVAIEDLLNRAQVPLDRDGMARLVRGQRVLVTGAGGTIGAELARQVAALGPSELLLLANGEILCGSNVEVSSYRLTLCAEQAAVGHAVARFGPQMRIAAVAVRSAASQPCSPCGACRQTLAEFAGPGTPVLFPGVDGHLCLRTLGELLPEAFALAHP